MITVSLNEKTQKGIERIQKGLGSGRTETVPKQQQCLQQIKQKPNAVRR